VVSKGYERALTKLKEAGAIITTVDAPELTEAHKLYEGGGFAGPESAQVHREMFSEFKDLYDPRVASRIEMGFGAKASDYVQLGLDRRQRIREWSKLIAPYDAMICPTVPCVAPLISEAGASDEAYGKLNLLLLRNTGLINALDGCAATVPCHEAGAAPVGLMVAGLGGTDANVLAVAAALETVISPTPSLKERKRKTTG